MTSLIENNGVFFAVNTPEMVQEVLLNCIEAGTRVHVLTGDPLTGLVTPKINSVGIIVKSEGKQPVPMLQISEGLGEDGSFIQFNEPKSYWLSTDRILKMADAEANELLYQSYDCQSAPLKLVSEVKVSPYGSVARKSKIVCSNPACEFVVPDDADAIEWCSFLFGKVHSLPIRK